MFTPNRLLPFDAGAVRSAPGGTAHGTQASTRSDSQGASSDSGEGSSKRLRAGQGWGLRFFAHDVHGAGEIVGEYVQRHF